MTLRQEILAKVNCIVIKQGLAIWGRLSAAAVAGLIFGGVAWPAVAATNSLPSAPLLYQLQNLIVTQAAASAFPVIVTDYSHDGSGSTELSTQEVATLKAGGAKTVLAYLSIGEAETYRFYWNTNWLSHVANNTNRPSWLGPANPQFRNNFKVRYWDPSWQSIIFGSTNAYCDRILAQGFDGVYLDVIDAYEFWGPDGNLPASQQNSNAVADMVTFVTNLAAYARSKPGHANFFVVPQNGAALTTNATYLSTISGIGSEDTWFNGDKRQRPQDTSFVIAFLDRVRASGKPVFATDYPQHSANIDAFYSFAEAKGYVPNATVRDLDRLIIQPHHDPASTLTVALRAPVDDTEVRASSVPTFGWSTTNSGPVLFRLNFSGSDAFQQVLTIPKSNWLTVTNCTPTAGEWKRIVRLAGDNHAGLISWWVTARDGAGGLRSSRASRLLRLHAAVSTTMFWVGEPADADNGFIPNNASAWDDLWQQHYGGVDDPNARSTNSAHPYWPAFTPLENPFYCALPYDDFTDSGDRRDDFQSIVPWAALRDYGPLESAVKNRWVKILVNGKTCYAQWEDVGPFNTGDTRYVFGIARPASGINNHAGLDVSPAVSQYLGLTGLDPTDWRFVFDDETVPAGPWSEVVTTNQITWLP
jgi:cysteinyl-tRNA synthetase, unknown class